jgi:3-deoxy-D-manno-octulosonic-acid transferase
MEPSGMGVPVVHGPHMHNFNDAMEILRECSGVIEVTQETLAPALEHLLTHREEARAMAMRAREAFLKKQGATARAVELVFKLVSEFQGFKVSGLHLDQRQP